MAANHENEALQQQSDTNENEFLWANNSAILNQGLDHRFAFSHIINPTSVSSDDNHNNYCAPYSSATNSDMLQTQFNHMISTNNINNILNSNIVTPWQQEIMLSNNLINDHSLDRRAMINTANHNSDCLNYDISSLRQQISPNYCIAPDQVHACSSTNDEEIINRMKLIKDYAAINNMSQDYAAAANLLQHDHQHTAETAVSGAAEVNEAINDGKSAAEDQIKTHRRIISNNNGEKSVSMSSAVDHDQAMTSSSSELDAEEDQMINSKVNNDDEYSNFAHSDPVDLREGSTTTAADDQNTSLKSHSHDSDADQKATAAKKQQHRKKPGQKRKRQARVALLTKSDVEHLEDGFRWRKYGQKAVKNSPYPRSYYRCTNSKCTVKKRVERSSHDSSMVITTYEGQHNHHSPFVLRGMLENQYTIMTNKNSNELPFPGLTTLQLHGLSSKSHAFGDLAMQWQTSPLTTVSNQSQLLNDLNLIRSQINITSTNSFTHDHIHDMSNIPQGFEMQHLHTPNLYTSEMLLDDFISHSRAPR